MEEEKAYDVSAAEEAVLNEHVVEEVDPFADPKVSTYPNDELSHNSNNIPLSPGK